MPKKQKKDTAQTDLIDVRERMSTAPCVIPIRNAVNAWREGGYKGVTKTTRELLNFWFYTDHKMPNGANFRYYASQRVERWKEYYDQLNALKRKPILFIMMNSTKEADEVADWMRTKYPSLFSGDKTLVIHTDKAGEVSKKDLDDARKASHDVDLPDSPVNAIVSVLMLREGWDVKNVTVVVGLCPYTAKANILPEQTIGRGLRLMFRDLSGSDYTRVAVPEADRNSAGLALTHYILRIAFYWGGF